MKIAFLVRCARLNLHHFKQAVSLCWKASSSISPPAMYVVRLTLLYLYVVRLTLLYLYVVRLTLLYLYVVRLTLLYLYVVRLTLLYLYVVRLTLLYLYEVWLTLILLLGVCICCDPEDFTKHFQDSAMSQLIDKHRPLNSHILKVRLT